MLSGWMSRSGANGWEIGLYNKDRLGKLPQNSELYEILRQTADLLFSGEREGTICGSNKKFEIQYSKLTGARFIRIPLVGVIWIVSENLKPGAKTQVKLTMTTDFVFEEGDAPRNEDVVEVVEEVVE